MAVCRGKTRRRHKCKLTHCCIERAAKSRVQLQLRCAPLPVCLPAGLPTLLVERPPHPHPTCSADAAAACTACTIASDTMYCTNGRRCPGMSSRCTAENMRQPSGDSHTLPPRPAHQVGCMRCSCRGTELGTTDRPADSQDGCGPAALLPGQHAGLGWE